MLPTFFTFYTDHKYKSLAARLAKNLSDYGISLRCIEGKDMGSWKHNCKQKPHLVRKALASEMQPIVWLDADCTIHSNPTWLVDGHWLEYDAALWLHDWSKNRALSSAVMAFNYTNNSMQLLNSWCIQNKKSSKLEDYTFKRVVQDSNARIACIPREYRVLWWKKWRHQKTPVIVCNERATEYIDGKTTRYSKRKRKVKC